VDGVLATLGLVSSDEDDNPDLENAPSIDCEPTGQHGNFLCKLPFGEILRVSPLTPLVELLEGICPNGVGRGLGLNIPFSGEAKPRDSPPGTRVSFRKRGLCVKGDRHGKCKKRKHYIENHHRCSACKTKPCPSTCVTTSTTITTSTLPITATATDTLTTTDTATSTATTTETATMTDTVTTTDTATVTDTATTTATAATTETATATTTEVSTTTTTATDTSVTTTTDTSITTATTTTTEVSIIATTPSTIAPRAVILQPRVGIAAARYQDHRGPFQLPVIGTYAAIFSSLYSLKLSS